MGQKSDCVVCVSVSTCCDLFILFIGCFLNLYCKRKAEELDNDLKKLFGRQEEIIEILSRLSRKPQHEQK